MLQLMLIKLIKRGAGNPGRVPDRADPHMIISFAFARPCPFSGSCHLKSVTVKLKDSHSRTTNTNLFIARSFLDIFARVIMATGPQPPSFDEHLASFESHPLFMSSLPDDTTDNAALSALQSLVHDGTPDGRSVPFFRCPRRWRSHAHAKKKSRKTLRNRETNTSKESVTERR